MNAICKCEPCQRRQIRRRFSELGQHDIAIVAALRHLREIEPDPAKLPDLRIIRVRPIDGATTAIVLMDRRRRKTIVVDPESAFYAAARAGDVLPLALVLHHEQHHILHGAEEAGAYRATLALAERAQAPRHLIDLIADIATTNT